MLKIDTSDLQSLAQRLGAQGKQAAYAASRALNTTAFAVMREGRAHIERGLDNPTRWTVSSWYVRERASKAQLRVVVGWSDYLANKGGNAADYYLAQHFSGGSRRHKAFEKRLQRAGILPEGMYAVPGNAADELGLMDRRSGNMKPGAIVAILSAVQALSGPGSSGNAAGRKRWSANKRAAAQVYWAGKPGPNTPLGIWAIDDKHGNGRGRLRPVMVFVSHAHYRKRLDLQRIADATVARTFNAAFAREYAEAMRTAR